MTFLPAEWPTSRPPGGRPRWADCSAGLFVANGLRSAQTRAAPACHVGRAPRSGGYTVFPSRGAAKLDGDREVERCSGALPCSRSRSRPGPASPPFRLGSSGAPDRRRRATPPRRGGAPAGACRSIPQELPCPANSGQGWTADGALKRSCGRRRCTTPFGWRPFRGRGAPRRAGAGLRSQRALPRDGVATMAACARAGASRTATRRFPRTDALGPLFRRPGRVRSRKGPSSGRLPW